MSSSETRPDLVGMMPDETRAALSAHFKMLMWVFAPAARIRNREQAEPRLYWLTREALSRNLTKLKVG